MKKYSALLFCLRFFSIDAQEFIYPVADFDKGDQLIVLYQKSLQDVELWFVNNSTQDAIKGLSSFSTPVNVRMLPSGKGFSFIDQGYIKIKEFAKRSARTLSIYEPIGLFSNMHWIDENNFYFVALQGDFFQIFTSDLESQVTQLTDEKADALYPQIIDQTLFYIQRDTENNFRLTIKKTDYSINFSEITLENQPCYLQMISLTEGFYIQAPTSKNQIQDDCYQFICHHLKKIDDTWKVEQVFDFYIPIQYITGSYRLYESIEPFLPKYQQTNSIYFTSWNRDRKNFELKKYTTTTRTCQTIENLMRTNNGALIFAPYFCNSKIYCGMIGSEESKTRNFMANENQLTLPYYYEIETC